MLKRDREFEHFMRQRLHDILLSISDYDIIDILDKFMQSDYGLRFSLGSGSEVFSSYNEACKHVNHFCGGYIPKQQDYEFLILYWMGDIYFTAFTVYGYNAHDFYKIIKPRDLYNIYDNYHHNGDLTTVANIIRDFGHIDVSTNNDIPKINSFKGNNFYLSNFYSTPVTYGGITYLNNEAAFQAQKCVNKIDRLSFTKLNPSDAKKRGRSVYLRKDWEEVKIQKMYEIVLAKFTQNEDLKEKLLLTGDIYLEEGNDWGDRVWGTVNGIGANNLGKILMKVRDELREQM